MCRGRRKGGEWGGGWSDDPILNLNLDTCKGGCYWGDEGVVRRGRARVGPGSDRRGGGGMEVE